MSSYIRINKKIGNFKNSIEIPGDKSISIRLIMLASIAIGKSRLYNLLDAEDISSTINSLKSLGVKILKNKKTVEVFGVGLNGLKVKKNFIINAGNSGTFARLLCGLVAKTDRTIKLVGDKSLSKRDFSRVVIPLNKFGINFRSKNNKLPLIIQGTKNLRPIRYVEEKGSAQVKSAILIASLNTPGETTIKCIPSRNHTELMFKHCLGVPITVKRGNKYEIIKVKGQKQFKCFNYNVPGDVSAASFFIALTILSKNSELIIKNVNVNKTRNGIIEILKKMRGKLTLINKRLYNGEIISDIKVESTYFLKSINCPKRLNTKSIDEFLIIFLLCAKAKGVSTFKDIQELRHKESDRLKIASNFLTKIGIKIVETRDSLKIYGNPSLELSDKFEIKNFLKDHRVFMMSCIAALTMGGDFKIHDRDSINSSFPNFIKILKKLGASII